MSPTNLTAIGGFVLSLIALIVLPLVFRRQATKQVKAQEEKAAIKEQAERDAAAAAGEVISWEKINQRLAATAEAERVAHRERIVELREDFAQEATRLKRQTDQDLDRAKEQIQKLSERVEELNRHIATLGAGK